MHHRRRCTGIGVNGTNIITVLSSSEICCTRAAVVLLQKRIIHISDWLELWSCILATSNHLISNFCAADETFSHGACFTCKYTKHLQFPFQQRVHVSQQMAEKWNGLNWPAWAVNSTSHHWACGTLMQTNDSIKQPSDTSWKLKHVLSCTPDAGVQQHA